MLPWYLVTSKSYRTLYSFFIILFLPGLWDKLISGEICRLWLVCATSSFENFIFTALEKDVILNSPFTS
jgi:hypothetical protein